MQKTFALLALSAFNGVEAFTSNDHPFTGENAEKNIIMHADGTATARASGIADTVQKYEDIVSKRRYKTYKNSYDHMMEYVFGPSEQTLAFEAQVDALHAKNHSSKHRLGSKQTFESDKDDLFVGTFYMGGPTLYEGQGIIDTATDLNVVLGYCQTCNKTEGLFDLWQAIDSNKGDISGRNTTATYGNVTFTGAWAEGEIFLNQNGDGLESNRFEFLYSQEVGGTETLDKSVKALFGLARTDRKLRLNTSQTPQSGKTPFLDIFSGLEDDDKKLFSTRFSTDHFSWIDYGTLNDQYVEADKMIKNPVFDDFFWSMGMRGVKIGDYEATWAYNNQTIYDEKNGIYTILDSGASEIFISNLYFQSFLKMFFEQHSIEEYKAEDGKVTSKCTSFKSLFFLMGQQWIEVPSEDYFFKSGDLCEFKFKSIDAPFNIVGIPFYKDYYVTHGFSETDSFISWNNNGRTKKEQPQSVDEGWATTNLLTVELATQDEEDPELKAFVIATIVAVLVIVGITWYAIYEFNNNSIEAPVMGLIIIGGVVVAAVVWVVLIWLLYEGLTPGESLVEVKPADEAVTKVVKLEHVAVFSLLSAALYKVFGKKQQKEVEATETLTEEAEEAISNHLM